MRKEGAAIMKSNHAVIGVTASVMRGTAVFAVAGAHPAIATAAAAAPRKRRAARAIAASVRGFR
ncbi:hypothetical protein CRI77_16550 [Mycolicibacterium duvalii]|nr:hypothetical protein CRI77_16550 [Mycolicibacterium duvalii]